MKISKISFTDGTRQESTICDCCGKSIQNVYYITLVDNSSLRLGTTCFEKQMKTKLDKMAKRKVDRAIKGIKRLENMREYWRSVTEENFYEDHPTDTTVGNTESIDTFEDYRKWMIDEFIPYRISCDEEEIRKYAKL